MWDRLPPPSAPPGPTVPSVRCVRELRPRRYAHRGIHPPELRSTAALQTAQPGRCLRGPHTPPIGRRESDRLALLPRPLSPWPPSDRWTPGPPPRRCGRMDPRAKSIDESAYRGAGSPAQSAQGTCGIARDHRILVSQCPSQRRLNPFCMGRQVNQFVDGVAPDGVPLMPQQVHQGGVSGKTRLRLGQR